MKPKRFDPNYCYSCDIPREDGHVCRPSIAVIPRAPGEARTPGWRSQGLSPNMKLAVTSSPNLDRARVALDVARAEYDAAPSEDTRLLWHAAEHAHNLAYGWAQGKWDWVDGRAVWKNLEDGAAEPPRSVTAAREMFLREDKSRKASQAALAAASGSSEFTSPAYMHSWARWVATADDPVDPFPPLQPKVVAPVEAAPVEVAPVEVAPVEAAPVEASSVEVEAAPVDAKPAGPSRVARLVRRVVAGLSKRILEVR